MNSYDQYLKLDQLLSLQTPLNAGLRAETLFIVSHQVSELWFKVAIEGLEETIEALWSDDVEQATESLRTVGTVERLLVDQLDLLERLRAGDFERIRENLAPASGAESSQFRRIESLSRVGSSQSQAELWVALARFLARRGFDFPTIDDDEGVQRRLLTLRRVYTGRARDARVLETLFEALLDHDRCVSLWRYRHLQTAQRQIGRRSGTGGTEGVEFLEARLLKRQFFPELWTARATAHTAPAQGTVDGATSSADGDSKITRTVGAEDSRCPVRGAP